MNVTDVLVILLLFAIWTQNSRTFYAVRDLPRQMKIRLKRRKRR